MWREDQAFIAPYSVAMELDVPDRQVLEWIGEGELPTVKIAGFTRIPVDGYRSFLRRHLETA